MEATVEATQKVAIGDKLKRRETERLIAGKGTFVDDVQPAGVLYVGVAVWALFLAAKALERRRWS